MKTNEAMTPVTYIDGIVLLFACDCNSSKRLNGKTLRSFKIKIIPGHNTV